jgi:hypothetical protein
VIDLTGIRPFSIDAVRPLYRVIETAQDLIGACQIRHLGFVQGRMGNAGALALAKWLMANRDFSDRPLPGFFRSGTVVERILAGDILPEEQFAIELAEATEGAVLPDMFGQPARQLISSALGWTLASADEEEPVAGSLSPSQDRKPAPSNVVPLADGLPALSALGGALAPGRLFHPIADPRFPEGFVLTGCGIMLCLDASTAQAMRAAIDSGLAHVAEMRAVGGASRPTRRDGRVAA